MSVASRRIVPASRRGTRSLSAACAALLVSSLAACDRDEWDAAAAAEAADAFWANLAYHCDRAYPGSLTLEPPGDEMLRGDELLVVHFRSCTDRELQLPFHIEVNDGEWDRSRTWIFRRHPDGRLELRHDHRREDGSEDEATWYGGFSEEVGTATRHEFIFRDIEYGDGSIRGWRIEVEPEDRYTYGTIRDGEWTWRVDFDLSTPLPSEPPPPWGY
jgi:hypothetical protein